MTKTQKFIGTALAVFYILWQVFKIIIGLAFLVMVATFAIKGLEYPEAPPAVINFIIYTWVLLTGYELLKSFIQTFKRIRNVRKNNDTETKGDSAKPAQNQRNRASQSATKRENSRESSGPAGE